VEVEVEVEVKVVVVEEEKEAEEEGGCNVSTTGLQCRRAYADTYT
jgi:hypothetical protein